jgi:hypothetical protein
MRYLRIAALAVVAVLGASTIGSHAAELNVPPSARTHWAHHGYWAWGPAHGYWWHAVWYPPYGYWRHPYVTWNWHRWGMYAWGG